MPSPDAPDSLVWLQEQLQAFAEARAWSGFHTPKNLAMALAGEAGELVAEFQWLSPDEAWAVGQDQERFQAVRMEAADVAIYLLRLCSVLGIDLGRAIIDKQAQNELRFPPTGSH